MVHSRLGSPVSFGIAALQEIGHLCFIAVVDGFLQDAEERIADRVWLRGCADAYLSWLRRADGAL